MNESISQVMSGAVLPTAVEFGFDAAGSVADSDATHRGPHCADDIVSEATLINRNRTAKPEVMDYIHSDSSDSEVGTWEVDDTVDAILHDRVD